jgi:hypothetical protein
MANLGGIRHNEIVDVIRDDVREVVQERHHDWDVGLITAEVMLKMITGKIPDALAVWHGPNGGILIVEVGRYNLAKWAGALTEDDKPVAVMHVTFDGRASLINGTGNPIEREWVETTRAALATSTLAPARSSRGLASRLGITST